MGTMFIIFIVLFFFVLAIALGLATQRWLCQQEGEVADPEWQIYQQRYD